MSSDSSASVLYDIRDNARYKDEADITALSPLLGPPEDLSASLALSEVSTSNHGAFEQIITDPRLFVLSFVSPSKA